MRYDQELANLAGTYDAALLLDIERLKVAVAGASESSIIAVGSGGSFTVASLLCNLHEAYTGRVSRPATSLELICNPNLASASPVFLISAEGQNPDISEALRRARRHSARPLHVLTNRAQTPLTACAQELGDIATHVFELLQKDGYLATNSLLLDATLIARAYAELDRDSEQLPKSIDAFQIAGGPVSAWLEEAKPFLDAAAKRGNVIITYSPPLRPVAADFESKLSESALLHCQLADLRSFAHGRHLWLAERPEDCTILAIVEPDLEDLWKEMQRLIPGTIPILTMSLQASRPPDLLAGLIAEMRMISGIAHRLRKDPGRPDVPPFGRDLYYLDLPQLIRKPPQLTEGGEQSKYDALGARWPSVTRRDSMRRALSGFRDSLERQAFRAIVFDYDGTLCTSQRTDVQLPESILGKIRDLVAGGVVVGIASGRGGSVQEQLRPHIASDLWPRIPLGLYNGGWITEIGSEAPALRETSEFLSHVTRIVLRLKGLGVPIEQVRTTHPFQVSIRFREGIQTEGLWFVVADALRQAGLDVSSVERSKHSVDVLAPGVSKSRLVDHIIQTFAIDPYEVLTIGDQGAWPGNDSALLEHRFSMSVDMPSRRLDRGWKLAPPHKRDVDATLWYMDRMQLSEDGNFHLQLTPDIARGHS